MPALRESQPKGWRPPQRANILISFEERCRKSKDQPFLDDRPMVTSPSCTWEDFRRPLLRRFEVQGKVHWKERLGYGLDGVVWKAEICNRIFAVKVVSINIRLAERSCLLTQSQFWDNVAPEGTRYWAAQRECHNAALLQMMQKAVVDSVEPIYLHPDPTTWKDAVANLHAFSEEGRHERRFRSLPNAVPYSSIPRQRECFGWIKVSGRELHNMDKSIRPPRDTLDGVVREILPSELYHAVVYEFISEEHHLDMDVLQSQLDFFWLTGFCLVPLRVENWKGPGILIDMADIICPWHAGWFQTRYSQGFAKELFSNEENE